MEVVYNNGWPWEPARTEAYAGGCATDMAQYYHISCSMEAGPVSLTGPLRNMFMFSPFGSANDKYTLSSALTQAKVSII